ncbi:MAG: divalent metal cation transporter [Actinobacteria bacterium]|nr:divalent metal cation transporter [Actinomycetota bacterium]NBY14977.1 divalent metal cation transporter [Actinomycetota bacterium]
MTEHPVRKVRKHPRWMRILGPGLITGAADDDPSGIATYSQAGAAFGYGQMWTISLCLPLMIAVQEATARIGATTGKGLAKVTAENFSRRVLITVVGLILFANIINIGADIAAVGAALHLLIDVPQVLISTIFTILVVALMVFTNYHWYARILKIFALALLAYVVTALIVDEPWREIAKATFVPQFQWNFAYWYVIVGVLGTTISPYMFFWQAAEEVEELEYAQRQHEKRRTIREIRLDTSSGMVISQLGSWFMMLTTATVLHPNGITNIGTAADAAKALEPFAGSFAKEVFALGVVGMGMLGIPVLAGSASYAVSELFGWSEGLDLKAKEAKGFYGVIAGATVIGFALTLMGFDPIKALIFAAVVNGLVAVPLVFLIRKISLNKNIMGDFVGGRLSKSVLWLTFAVMTICALAMVSASFFQ